MQQRHGEEEQGTRGRLGNRMVMPADWRAAADLDRLLCARLLTDLLGCGVRASTASAAVLFFSRAEQRLRRSARRAVCMPELSESKLSRPGVFGG